MAVSHLSHNLFPSNYSCSAFFLIKRSYASLLVLLISTLPLPIHFARPGPVGSGPIFPSRWPPTCSSYDIIVQSSQIGQAVNSDMSNIE